MLTLAHQVPGRLRLAGPLLKTEQAEPLVRHVTELPGVTRVHLRSLTGSLVVFYDGTPDSRDRILQSAGLSPNTTPGPTLLDGLIELLVERTLTYAARAMVAAVL